MKSRVKKWVTGEDPPTPGVDLIAKRPTVLPRPHRDRAVEVFRQEMKRTRQPENILSRWIIDISRSGAAATQKIVAEALRGEKK